MNGNLSFALNKIYPALIKFDLSLNVIFSLNIINGYPLLHCYSALQSATASKMTEVMSKDNGKDCGLHRNFSSSFRKIADEIESTYVYQLQNSD